MTKKPKIKTRKIQVLGIWDFYTTISNGKKRNCENYDLRMTKFIYYTNEEVY